MTYLPLIDDSGMLLYDWLEGASMTPEAEHKSIGLALGNAIQSATGLSIGMSNCRDASEAFIAELASKPNPNFTFINGAKGGAEASKWVSPDAPQHQRVLGVISDAGYTPDDIDVIWLKMSAKVEGVPNQTNFVNQLVEDLGNCLRSIYALYPNLKLALFSSRSYSGYASVNPAGREAESYLQGVAIRRLVSAQIIQRMTGTIDPQAGDLLTACPFIDWLNYVWSNGNIANIDGVAWPRWFYVADGVHHNEQGQAYWARRLHRGFADNPYTKGFYNDSN